MIVDSAVCSLQVCNVDIQYLPFTFCSLVLSSFTSYLTTFPSNLFCYITSPLFPSHLSLSLFSLLPCSSSPLSLPPFLLVFFSFPPSCPPPPSLLPSLPIAVIEHVRDGATLRVILLPSYTYLTLAMSGVKVTNLRVVLLTSVNYVTYTYTAQFGMSYAVNVLCMATGHTCIHVCIVPEYYSTCITWSHDDHYQKVSCFPK